MNDGGMKQRRRFMVLWHIEYVWLSAVWWKRLDVSDGHAERNLLNDSIPPEMLQEEGFIFVYLIQAPVQTSVGRRWMERLWHKSTKPQKTKLKLDVRHYATRARRCTPDAWVLMSETRAGDGLLFRLDWLLVALRTDCISAHLRERCSRQKTPRVSSRTHVRLRGGAPVIARVERCSLSSVMR